MAIDVRDLSNRVARPGHRRRARHLRAHRRRVPRRPGRRGRLPRLPPEPGHLRPAPGRPQPDAAGEDPRTGGSRPSSSRCSRYIAETYSRGWGHLTTRQNVQFHFVAARADARGPAPPRVGRAHLPRGVRRHRAQRHGLPPRRRVPVRGARHHARGPRPPTDFLLRHPVRAAPAPQVQDQLLRLRHRLRPGDVQRRRRDRDHAARSPDGTVEPGFQVFIAGGLGANPHPAQALEEFTAREDLLPTIEACLRTFDHYGNRDNKIRARMKWLVDTMGIDELRERIFKERKFLRGARDWPGGIPAQRARARATRPAGGDVDRRRRRTIVGVPVQARSRPIRTSAGRKPTSCAASPTARSARYAYCPPRRHHHRAVPRPRRHPARLRARRPHHQPPELRAARPHRGRPARRSTTGSTTSAWPKPGAELARDVVVVPRRRHLQPRGHAVARPRRRHRRRARRRPASPRSAGVRVNISGCTNCCGQHHISDIGFFGLERRAHGRAAPGYQMLLGGHVGDMQIEFGEKAIEAAGQDGARSGRAGRRPFNERAPAGRDVPARGSTRSGGAKGVGETAQGPRPLPRRPTTAPSSTSTSTRPVPTSPRSATASARNMSLLGPSAIVDGRSSTSTSPSSPRSRPSSSTSPRRPRSSGRGSASAPASCSRRRSRTACSSTSPSQAAPEHRGRVPRHAVPLRRDALVRRAGARALRPQPHGHAAARSRPTTSGRPTPTSAARCARSSRSPARSPASRRG